MPNFEEDFYDISLQILDSLIQLEVANDCQTLEQAILSGKQAIEQIFIQIGNAIVDKGGKNTERTKNHFLQISQELNIDKDFMRSYLELIIALQQELNDNNRQFSDKCIARS